MAEGDLTQLTVAELYNNSAIGVVTIECACPSLHQRVIVNVDRDLRVLADQHCLSKLRELDVLVQCHAIDSVEEGRGGDVGGTCWLRGVPPGVGLTSTSGQVEVLSIGAGHSDEGGASLDDHVGTGVIPLGLLVALVGSADSHAADQTIGCDPGSGAGVRASGAGDASELGVGLTDRAAHRNRLAVHACVVTPTVVDGGSAA